MTGPVVEGRSRCCLSARLGSPACAHSTVAAVSTRGLILAAMLCGLAILAAFAIQILIAP
jgi:hypothetical protein